MKARWITAICLVLIMATPTLSSAAVTCSQDWVTGPNLPTARVRSAGAMVDDVLYVLGGWDGATAYDKNESYDYWADTWSTNTPMPGTNENHCATSWDGILYVIGGMDGPAKDYLWAYDPETDTWDSTLAQLPAIRTGLFCGAWEGKLYAAGGNDGSTDKNTLYIYDITTDSWTTGATMPASVAFGASAILDGYLYAMGGWPDLTTEHRYDIAGDSWATSLDPVPVGLQDPAVAFFTTSADLHYVYLIGGAQTWTPTDSFLEYAIGSGWSNFTGTKPLPESLMTQAGGNIHNAVFYSAGGATAGITADDSFYIFNYCGHYIKSADPSMTVAGATTSLDFVGAQFVDGTTFWLDDGTDTTYNLTSTTITSNTEASATIPASVPAGEYELWTGDAVSGVNFRHKIPYSVCDCVIDEECYDDGDTNPDNVCEVCDPGTSATTWTDNDGESCDDGLWCTDVDTCSGGICEGTDRDCDDGDFCTGAETCNEENDECDSAGDPCDEDEVCNEDTDSCDPAADDDDDTTDDDDDATDDDAADDDDDAVDDDDDEVPSGGDDDDDDDGGCCG